MPQILTLKKKKKIIHNTRKNNFIRNIVEHHSNQKKLKKKIESITKNYSPLFSIILYRLSLDKTKNKKIQRLRIESKSQLVEL